MKRAISLARGGSGKVSPNPLVGAVVVKNEKIIGQGYHEVYGGKHAEINALESCNESTNGATLYCNLEPCSKTYPGKHNPPCCDAIIEAKIKRVVVKNRRSQKGARWHIRFKLRGIAGVVLPGDLQLVDIFSSDLSQRREAGSPRIAPPDGPAPTVIPGL